MDIPLIECPECVAIKNAPRVPKPGEGATARFIGIVITPEDRKAGKVYCSHLSYREWERQGFSLDWARGSVGKGPEIRILRKLEKLSYRPGKLQVTYVILAPDIDRRPIRLTAEVDRESDTGGEFACKVEE